MLRASRPEVVPTTASQLLVQPKAHDKGLLSGRLNMPTSGCHFHCPPPGLSIPDLSRSVYFPLLLPPLPGAGVTVTPVGGVGVVAGDASESPRPRRAVDCFSRHTQSTASRGTLESDTTWYFEESWTAPSAVLLSPERWARLPRRHYMLTRYFWARRFARSLGILCTCIQFLHNKWRTRGVRC